MRFIVIKGRIILFALLAVIGTVLLLVKAVVPASVTPVRSLPIYNVDRADNLISVTFDCAWNAEDIDEIIEVLDKYACISTFFVVGDWAEKYPEAVKKLAENGHEIANHSYNHKLYSKLTEEQMIEDMDRCDAVIEEIIGQKPMLFRPPSGDYNNAVVETCRKTGRVCIQWDVDSLDWRKLSTAEITQRVVSKTQSGSIILLHNGTPNTAAALSDMLLQLVERGFEFVPVSQIIYREGYTIDHAGKQILNAENTPGY